MDSSSSNKFPRNRFSRLSRDRFSRLPIEITQKILSFLSTKEVIQKSILSKIFQEACSTIPDLDFAFDGDFRNVQSASCFVNYVDHTLTRYREHSIPLKSFHLSTVVFDKISYNLEQCIRKVQDRGVEEVCLDIFFLHDMLTSSIGLLQAIFALEHLLVLKLTCCDLLNSVGSINCLSPIRVLKLVKFMTDERSLQKLFSFCPLVEELQIGECIEPENIQVTNLPNLKRLHVMTHYTMVYVKAECLELINYYSIFPSPYLLKIDSTQNLKEISLSEKNIRENQLLDLIAKFHALEKLILSGCNKIRKMNVSSHSLGFIRLDCCQRLTEVNIVHAPNLNYFELAVLAGKPGIPKLSFPSDEEGSACKIKLSVAMYLFSLEHASSFLELSESLMKLKQSDNILLHIHSRETNFDKSTINDLRVSVPEFEELIISVDSPLSAYSTLMEGLLWSFSAKIVCVKSYSNNNEFLKYLCKELLVEHDDSNNSTGCGHWRNYFKQAKFEGRDEKWRPLHSWKCQKEALQNLKASTVLKLLRN